MEGQNEPFLKFLGVKVAKSITKEFVEPHGDEDTWSEAAAKDYESNTKAQYALTQVFNDDDLSRVVNCKSAFEVWNDLLITYKGMSQIKNLKLTCFILNMRIFICLIINRLMKCFLTSLKSPMDCLP